MDKINEMVDMLLGGEIDKETFIKSILDVIQQLQNEIKKEEKIEEITEQEKQEKKEEQEEVKMYSNNLLLEAQILPLEADKEDIEAIENAIKTNMKIPLNLEHTEEIIGYIVDIIKKEDGYYAKFTVDKDIKVEDFPYLSAEIVRFDENGKYFPLLTGVALTSKPKIPVKKIEKVPDKVYSSLPYSIRILAYLHPKKQELFKLLTVFNKDKAEENKPDVYEILRQNVKEYLKKKYGGE